MGIARQVRQRRELAEHRHRDLGAQSALQLRERSDLPALEQPLQRVGIKAGWTHNVIIPPTNSHARRIHNIMRRDCKEPGLTRSPCFLGSKKCADHSSRTNAAILYVSITPLTQKLFLHEFLVEDHVRKSVQPSARVTRANALTQI